MWAPRIDIGYDSVEIDELFCFVCHIAPRLAGDPRICDIELQVVNHGVDPTWPWVIRLSTRPASQLFSLIRWDALDRSVRRESLDVFPFQKRSIHGSPRRSKIEDFPER